MGRLISEILEITDLSKDQVGEMRNLFCLYFDNVTTQRFAGDLKEKKWVILLKDRSSGAIRGFSTQMLVEKIIDNTFVKIVFSGDTIIQKEFWGEPTLARAWLTFFYSLSVKCGDDSKLFWFLMAMGYKTYRFLPVYFKQFYPCSGRETPAFEKRVIDTVALARYSREYDAATGVIHNLSAKEILKSGVADVSPAKMLNPHVKYFVYKNPGYLRGDELACLALISKENLKQVAYKVMGRPVERVC